MTSSPVRPGVLRFVGEPLVLLSLLLIVLGIWLLAVLGSGAIDGGTHDFDEAIMRWARRSDDPARLKGPVWIQSVIRDITSLGSVAVLALMVIAVVGALLIARRRDMVILLLAATLGATLISASVKRWIDRPRPQIVPRLTEVSGASFPSGHSAMSAAVYLTLAAVLARAVGRWRFKLYCLLAAVTVVFLVGISRVALGVHYPSDVLAGWTVGLVWALLCWLIARYLQGRGVIGKEPPPPASEAQP